MRVDHWMPMPPADTMPEDGWKKFIFNIQTPCLGREGRTRSMTARLEEYFTKKVRTHSEAENVKGNYWIAIAMRKPGHYCGLG